MIIKIFEQEVQQIPADGNIDGDDTNFIDPIAYLTGLQIHVDEADYPDSNYPYYIPELTIKNVFLGLVKSGNGNLRIGTLTITDTGGDAMRIHGSNMVVDKLVIRNNLPTRPYCPVTLPTGTNEHNIIERIHVALNTCKQEIRSAKLAAWIEIFDREGEAYQAIPGDHADLVHIFNIECDTDGHKPNVLRSQLTPKDFSDMITDMQKQPGLRTADAQELIQNILNGISNIPHKWIVNPKTKKAESLELINRNNIIELNSSERFAKESLLYDLDKRAIVGSNSRELKPKPKPRAKASCAISSVHLSDIDLYTDHRNIQVFMLSEENNYTDFKIGTRNLKVYCAYSYWLVANTLNKSEIGNLYRIMDITCANKPALAVPTSASCVGNCGNTAVCNKVPTIRIGDGIDRYPDPSPYAIKASHHRTFDVTFNRLSNVAHSVPPSSITYINP